MPFVLQATGDGTRMARAVQQLVLRADPSQSIPRVSTLDANVAGDWAGPRFYTAVVAGFGVIAVLLAMVRIHGTISYMVSRQPSEIGIRVALAAPP